MQRTTLDGLQRPTRDQTGQHDDLASRAKQRVLNALRDLSVLEQNRAPQELVTREGWSISRAGGFSFEDGSVLCRSGSEWHALSAEEACARLRAQLQQPLEVRLLHTYFGRDGREKRSVSEARFEFREGSGGWRLVVEYEAYMDSPFYGFEADGFGTLLELELCSLWIDTPQPFQRWRLEQIAFHPDWLELLHVSRKPI